MSALKKRIIKIAVPVVIVLIVAWRFWPRSFSKLIPYDMELVTYCIANVDIMRVSNGRLNSESYKLDDMVQGDLEKIMELAATSGYRRDFRNLIPFGPRSLSSGKDYDGRAVNIYLFFGTEENEYDDSIHISWTDGQMAIWGVSKYKARIYHPTNSETLDYLVGYLQANGELQ